MVTEIPEARKAANAAIKLDDEVTKRVKEVVMDMLTDPQFQYHLIQVLTNHPDMRQFVIAMVRNALIQSGKNQTWSSGTSYTGYDNIPYY